jgi:hypothetical protein
LTIAAGYPASGQACGVQNLHYTYDPVGNITHIQDDAQQTIYFRNQRVEPSNDYTYDAIYRLIQASGREHLGQLANGDPNPPTAPDAFNDFHTRQDHPNVLKAMGAYIERYVYDAVGNFLQMQHRGSDPAHAGWTRAYVYLEASLIEDGIREPVRKTSNRLTSTTLNPAGNSRSRKPISTTPTATWCACPTWAWGCPGRTCTGTTRTSCVGPTSVAVAQPSTSTTRQASACARCGRSRPALTEERIYLGGFEIFRTHNGPIGANTATLERETLHVMDDKQRIALVETRTLEAAGTRP